MRSLCFVATIAIVFGCSNEPVRIDAGDSTSDPFPLLHTRRLAPIDLDNPKAQLGARLFRENRMSNPGSQYLAACNSCHKPPDAPTGARAYADIEPLSLIPSSSDDMKNLTDRNTPTLIDAARASRYGWIGQYDSLEDVIKAQMLGREFGWLPDQREQAVNEVHALILNDIGVGTSNDGTPYIEAFKSAYEVDLSLASGEHILDAVVLALADYVRLLMTVEGPPIELDELAAEGYAIFMGAGNCAACHRPPLFTDYQFHETGVALVHSDDADGSAIKTPPLHHLNITNPYMHNGQYATIEDAIRQKIEASQMAEDGMLDNTDPLLLEMNIAEEDIAPLAAFLRALDN